MKLHIKKLYKETVHQLEKHQTEIEIALAVAAMATVAREDEEVIAANQIIAEIYQEILMKFESEIMHLNAIMGEYDAPEEE